LRKALIIAHQFPPLAGSGSFRPAKFVKYLDQLGWQPYVITTQVISSLGFDQTLTEDLPGTVPILRISSPFPKPRDRVIRWLVEYSPVCRHEIKRAFDKTWEPRSIINRTLRIFLKIFLFPLTLIQYPPIDPVIYWSIKIISPAYKLIKSEQIEVIFTTSAPWSSLISGLILKKITGQPWVADMRDPWTTEELRYGTKSWRRAIDKYLERLCLRNADIVIGVTSKWLEDLQRITGEESAVGKYELITNGYDESDFEDCSVPFLNSKSEIMISHVGSMFRGGLEPLLLSLNNFNGELLERIRFELIGYVHPLDQESLANSTARSSFYCQPKRITHVQSLQIMRESHVLLLTLPFEYYPGKLFEYMRVGRPVLALVPEGSVANLIERAQIGCVIYRENTDRLSEVLEQILFDYDGFVQKHYQPNWDFIRQFERKILTKKLSSIFDRVSVQ
jgi:glycosyltransferase involved in cell wall biosynthesis